MTYEQVLDFLYSQLPMFQRVGAPAYKHDLGKTLVLDQYFGQPHKRFKTIHIAGTNGKGSVAHTLASVLQEAGYKTGLYTSPHYLDFRERIKINGQPIDKQYVIDFVQKNLQFFQQVKPSFFELTVAMAFQYFADQSVDIAVIEVGLGGRLDSTNIITPLASVITNIGYDHTQFLGNTLTQIAAEKAGIIKPNVSVIIGQMAPAVRNVFLQKAQQTNSPIFLANHIYSVADFHAISPKLAQMRVYKNGALAFPTLRFGLIGEYQQQNVPVILTTIDVLRQKHSLGIEDQHILNGFERVVENTGIMGRWQVLQQKPLMVADAAHNPDGLKVVMRQATMLKPRKLHVVFSTVNDKPLDKILPLLPKQAAYYFTRSSVQRSMPAQKLRDKAADYGLNGKAFDHVEQAISAASSAANPEDMILITGSTFVVADALKLKRDDKT